MKRRHKIFSFIGRYFLGICEELGQLFLLLVSTIKFIFKKPFDFKLAIKQMATIGVDSLPVAMIIGLFTGMVFTLQAGLSLEDKIAGVSVFLGGIIAFSEARELAPVLTALIVAGRVGSAIAAEIGTMNVTEQIDALKTLATPPVKYLVVPRFIAMTIMMPILTMISGAIGFLGGMFVSTKILLIPSRTYIQSAQEVLRMGDITGGLIKSVFFGMFIVLVACHKGFKTSGGAEGVGKVTTESVVISSILILISDYFLTTLLNFVLKI